MQRKNEMKVPNAVTTLAELVRLLMQRDNKTRPIKNDIVKKEQVVVMLVELCAPPVPCSKKIFIAGRAPRRLTPKHKN